VFEPRRFGAYTLEAKLGHGGMAEVFRATREGVAGFARTCVVKRILGPHNEDPTFVDMFINEAKIAAKLTHPNIVQVYELGQVNGEFFIAMEYVNGRDLLRILRELAQTRPDDPAIPPSLAAYIARETCRGLQVAHDHADERGKARPIIHRDISPQNIMISFDGVVKLVDFGIAKALGTMREDTRTGALKGKFAYMAPEHVEGQSPGPSADVFSTGVVLHEMLTGRRLFKGPTDYDTLSKVRSMTVPPPSTLNPSVPPELDAIALRALERDRAVRYEKAAQMARELDSYLQTARFSVEEMTDYMRELFPADVELGADQLTKEYLTKDSTSSTEQTSADPGSGGSLVMEASYASQRPEITPTGSGGRRAILVAGGLALLVGVGAVFIFGPRGPAEPTHSATRAEDGTPKSTRPSDPPEVIQLSHEMRVVRLLSEPPRARIFDGPRLLGQAPLDLRLPADSPGMTVTLVHEGRMDLSYVVRASDAPELTLRLAPLEATASFPPPAQETRQPGFRLPPPRLVKPAATKPKVEIFDDEPVRPKASPKIPTLEE
jgi:serine/threonine protein kinase